MHAKAVPTRLVHAVVAIIALLTLWRLAIAWILPVTQDEAYYFDWARSLAWGYFDHPPGVALFGTTSLLAPTSTLAARLGTVISGALVVVVLAFFFHRCGLRARDDLLLALVIAAGSVAGLASAALTTPDAVLALAWVLALHEALVALQGQRRRWLSAGLATGLGLLGKYTMVLIGPVFLWAILWADPRALRTPWPYVGALVALLVFAPHVLWNAENDWITMRFQLGHGFSAETDPLVVSTLPPPADGAFGLTPLEPPMQGLERVNSVLDYLGTQVGLWGLFAIVLVAAAFLRPRPRDHAIPWTPGARELLIAGTLVPFVFFAMVAGVSAVEPNWPVVYLFCAAPLVTPWLRRLRPWVFVAAAGNVGLVSLYAIHGASAALPLPDNLNRVLRETHGYDELARWVAQVEGPVFADRYQTTAMLRFYSPGSTATQWPGLTRPSEYLRGEIAATPELEHVRNAGGFWLVARLGREPAFDGFKMTARTLLHDCAGEPLAEALESPCSRPLHRWVVYRFDVMPKP